MRTLTVAVAASIAAAACGPAWTADDRSQLEEIIVTAQKRAESIQTVPIAITALSGESLASMQITSSDELERLAPTLTWKPAGGAGASVGIRGVVDTVFTTNQVGSVGIVVDEVGLNSPISNTFGLFDLDRIEILRGPQVTLYGRSTTGGAVSVVTRRPRVEDGTNGALSLTGGSFAQHDVELALGAALGSDWAIRVAGMAQQRNGIIRNTLLGTDDWDRNRRAARVSLAGKPSDSLSVFATAHYAANRGQNYRYKDVGMLDPVTGGPCTTIRDANPGNGCVDGGGFADNGDFTKTSSNFPAPIDDIDAGGASLDLTWSLGPVALTSISAFERSRIRRAEDTDGGALSLAEVYYSADVKQWTEELRLANQPAPGALRWIAGVYVLGEDQTGLTANVIRTGTDVGPPPQFRSQAFDQRDKIYSGYGQFDIPVSRRLTATVGGRYSSETKSGTSETLRAPGPIAAALLPPIGTFIDEAIARSIAVKVDAPPPDFVPVNGPFVAPYDKTWRNWGGKAGLNFQANDRTLLYGSVSRGFKGGTFNFAAGVRLSSEAQRLNFQRGVDPEELTTYELGAKFESEGRSVRANVAVFRNDYTNQQTFTFKDGGPVLVNAAASTINGLEAELEWLPVQGLRLSGGLGWLDAKYDEFIDTDGTVYSGNRMLQAPKLTLNGAIRKSWITRSGEWSVQASAHYVGDQYFGVDNAPVTLVGAETLTDAQLAYAFGDSRHLQISLWGKNIGDRRFCAYTGTLPFGNAQCIPNEPRTYGVTFGAKF